MGNLALFSRFILREDNNTQSGAVRKGISTGTQSLTTRVRDISILYPAGNRVVFALLEQQRFAVECQRIAIFFRKRVRPLRNRKIQHSENILLKAPA